MRFVGTALVIIYLSTPALADDEFAAALKESTGDYTSMFVLSKLNTFKLGKKCVAKLPDKSSGAVHAAGFATRDIIAWAKDVTGEDWYAIENQNNSDRETNKTLVEPKVDAFKSHFSMTTIVDGDDCDASANSLWIRYWSGIATNIKNYPPPSGKAFVTLEVSSKIKDVTVDVGKDGATFSIKAPKDIEAKQWSDKLERPFRKLNSGIVDDFAFATKEATGRYYSAWVLTKFHTFKLGKKCTAKLSDPNLGAVHAATFATRDFVEYAKANGAEDWDAVEQQSANDPKTNRGLVEKDMDSYKSRLAISISVEGDDCDAKQNSLWLRYWTTIATALRDYPPKAKKISIKLDVRAGAKDVSASGSNGSYTITAPRDKEVAQWSDKIIKAFSSQKKK